MQSGRNPAVLKPETRKYLYRAGIIGSDELGGGEVATSGSDDDFPSIPDYGIQ